MKPCTDAVVLPRPSEADNTNRPGNVPPVLCGADDRGVPDSTHQNDNEIARNERGPLMTIVHSRVDHPRLALIQHPVDNVPRLKQWHPPRMMRAGPHHSVCHRSDTGKSTHGVAAPCL